MEEKAVDALREACVGEQLLTCFSSCLLLFLTCFCFPSLTAAQAPQGYWVKCIMGTLKFKHPLPPYYLLTVLSYKISDNHHTDGTMNSMLDPPPSLTNAENALLSNVLFCFSS